jgi:hypothetical protein
MDEQEVTFRKLLLNICWEEFEKNSEIELNKKTRHKVIQQTRDPVNFLNVFGNVSMLLLSLSTYHYSLRILRFL